jgi:nucleotide-binding universal stress UspA family protein
MAVFRRILVATDFSEASGGAVALAVAMAREAAAALHVLHVCDAPPYPDLGGPVDLMTPVVEAAQQRLDDLMASLRDVVPAAKGILEVGAAWEQILAAAAEVAADLVVLGTHGRRGVAHILMGSVAQRVVSLCEVPVLTVRSGAPGRDAAA